MMYFAHRFGSLNTLTHLSEIEMRELFLNISHFSVEQIGAIHPTRMKFLWALPWLSVEQIKAFKFDQISNLVPEQLNLLSAVQVQALTHDDRRYFSRDQVRGLDTAFIKAMFPETTVDSVRSTDMAKIAALASSEDRKKHIVAKVLIVHCGLLRREQLQAIGPDQMDLFRQEDLKTLSIGQIPDLTPEQIKMIRPEAFYGFTDVQMPHFTEAQIQAFTADQVKTIVSSHHWSALPDKQMTYFLPEQISQFGASYELCNFLTAWRISHLTREQVQALTIEQIKILKSFYGEYQALLARPDLTSVQRQALTDY